jgi:hypothetical protein
MFFVEACPVRVVVSQHKQTPLHVAAMCGHYDVVRWLVHVKGAAVDLKDEVRAGGAASRVFWCIILLLVLVRSKETPR